MAEKLLSRILISLKFHLILKKSIWCLVETFFGRYLGVLKLTACMRDPRLFILYTREKVQPVQSGLINTAENNVLLWALLNVVNDRRQKNYIYTRRPRQPKRISAIIELISNVEDG